MSLKYTRTVFFIYFFCSYVSSIYSKEYFISDSSQLLKIQSAIAGDILIFKSGIWDNVHLKINKGGEKNFPIIFKAQSGGEVVFTGSSFIEINAPNIIIDGFSFKNGSIDRGAVISMNSEFGVLKNTEIVDYNPKQFDQKYVWLQFNGSNNKVMNSLFEGKTNNGPVVLNSEIGSKNNFITRSYFKNIPLKEHSNGREIIKILGPGHVYENSSDGAFFSLKENLFENADGEGVEIISIKSNRNLIQENTFLSSSGSLNVRRGTDNIISKNTFLCNAKSGAQGIRMSGQRNLIEKNYISNCEYGIAVSSGEFWDHPLTNLYDVNDRNGSKPNKSRYPQNKFDVIRENIFVFNSGPDLDIGDREYKKHWPIHQNVLIPESCEFIKNISYRSRGGVAVVGAQVDNRPPLDQFHFEPNTFIDNFLYGGKNIFPSTNGLIEIDFPINWSESQIEKNMQIISSDDVGPNWKK